MTDLPHNPGMPLWAKAAIGVTAVGAIGGIVFVATRSKAAAPAVNKLPSARKPARKPARIPGRRTGTKKKKKTSELPPPPRGARPSRGDPPPRRRGTRKRKPRKPDIEPIEEPTTVKGKLAGSGERRTAAIIVVASPTSYPPRNKTKQSGQAQADWLADVAYWSAYPNAPAAIDPKDASHKRWVKAWLRIRAYVTKGLALKPKLGEHPIKAGVSSLANENWQRWALAVAFSSPLRTAAALREGYKKAWNYVFLDAKGVVWQNQHMSKKVAGTIVSIEGLMADVAVWMREGYAEGRRQLDKWPETVTKAFASANRTAETK